MDMEKEQLRMTVQAAEGMFEDYEKELTKLRKTIRIMTWVISLLAGLLAATWLMIL